MLGTVTKSAAEAKETLRRIKAAGYDGLEVNRFMLHPSPLVVRLLTKAAGMPTGKGGKLNWNALIKESGLEVVSLHTDLGSLEREGESVAREAKALGAAAVVITGMYRFDYADEAAVRGLADRLNRAGETLNAQGLSLLYHNHNAELSFVCPGVRAYDLLIDGTDPALVGFEFDSYWFADGGADPRNWMLRLGSRMKLWHVTDRGSRLKGAPMTPIIKADAMEAGTGNMDLAGLYALAEHSGARCAVLETHRNWIDGDPLKSIELSAKFFAERNKT